MPPSALHALLIGIDDYERRPLAGCVNDVEAIERWLRAHASVTHLRKLVAPIAPRVPSDPLPTGAAIRDAFVALASAAAAGDRVFVYYSGHGLRERDRAGRVAQPREALVPVDAWADDGSPSRVLWDVEINPMLQQIVARGAHLTVVLDCCHAAGVTRSTRLATGVPLGEARALDPEELDDVAPPADAATSGHGRIDGTATDGWALVAACRDHEVAREVGKEAASLGVFTRALLAALDTEGAGARAATIRWSELWPAIVDAVGTHNPRQNPQEHRAWGRPFLGGSRSDGDVGWRVQRSGAGFTIDAGKVHGLVEGALVAVYGETPAVLPPVGAPEEEQVRAMLLRVVSVERSTAHAEVSGSSHDLPRGARARLHALPAAARLAVRVPEGDETAARAIAASTLLRRASPDERAEVWVEASRHTYGFGDDLYDSMDPTGERGLGHVDLDEVELRVVLEHYHRYCAPLRIARDANFAGRLVVEVIDCSDAAVLEAMIGDDAGGVAATPEVDGAVDVRVGGRFCVRVTSSYEQELQVALFCLEIDGRVMHIGTQAVAAGRHTTWWSDEGRGKAFSPTLPPGRRSACERLVAIGTTRDGVTLDHLAVPITFQMAVQVTRTTRDGGAARPIVMPPTQPLRPERWLGAVCPVRLRKA